MLDIYINFNIELRQSPRSKIWRQKFKNVMFWNYLHRNLKTENLIYIDLFVHTRGEPGVQNSQPSYPYRVRSALIDIKIPSNQVSKEKGEGGGVTMTA